MKLIGTPFTIHNTDGPNWLVRWDEVALDEASGESVSFTVAVPKSPNLSVAVLERHAVMRAAELLQNWLRHAPALTPDQ